MIVMSIVTAISLTLTFSAFIGKENVQGPQSKNFLDVNVGKFVG